MATEPRSSRCRLGELGSMAGLLDLPGLTCDVCGDRGDDDADDEDDRAGPDDLLDGDRASLVASVLDDAVLHAGDHGERRHLEDDEELQHRIAPFWWWSSGCPGLLSVSGRESEHRRSHEDRHEDDAEQ